MDIGPTTTRAGNQAGKGPTLARTVDAPVYRSASAIRSGGPRDLDPGTHGSSDLGFLLCRRGEIDPKHTRPAERRTACGVIRSPGAKPAGDRDAEVSPLHSARSGDGSTRPETGSG